LGGWSSSCCWWKCDDGSCLSLQCLNFQRDGGSAPLLTTPLLSLARSPPPLPLPPTTAVQAEEFKKYLAANQTLPDVQLILGESETKSTMVSSNLRRAISTGMLPRYPGIVVVWRLCRMPCTSSSPSLLATPPPPFAGSHSVRRCVVARCGGCK
jgi:hypothetical protein